MMYSHRSAYLFIEYQGRNALLLNALYVMNHFYCSIPLCTFLVSPYLKTLCMVTCTRLLHLMESFATPWFLCAKPTNHYLIFYLLESFNNIIQYQFDGKLPYTAET